MEIVGETEPTPVFGTIGSFPLQNNGTIIKSLAKSGPAVIAASSSPDSLYGGFSAVHVVIKNLDVRTYDDPGIGGIDLQYALQCKLENVFINTGVYNVQASKPTHGTRGLITPACNNAALTILRNVVVTGYHSGIVVNEHTDGDNIVVASNINGLEFVFAHHASRFGRVGTYRNTHHLAVSGRHGFSIEQMNTEQPGRDKRMPRTPGRRSSVILTTRRIWALPISTTGSSRGTWARSTSLPATAAPRSGPGGSAPPGRNQVTGSHYEETADCVVVCCRCAERPWRPVALSTRHAAPAVKWRNLSVAQARWNRRAGCATGANRSATGSPGGWRMSTRPCRRAWAADYPDHWPQFILGAAAAGRMRVAGTGLRGCRMAAPRFMGCSR